MTNTPKVKRTRIMKRFHPHKFIHKHLSLKGVAIFLLLVMIGIGGVVGFLSGAATGRISTGVTVGPIVVGGLTEEEAVMEINRWLDGYQLHFQVDDLKADFNPLKTPKNDGQPIATVDAAEAAKQAYAVGRRAGTVSSSLERIAAYLMGRNIETISKIDRDALEQELKVRFAGVFSPANNAQVKVSLNGNGTVQTELIPERPGTNLQTDRAAALAEQRLKQLSGEVVRIDVRYDQPKVPLTEAEAAAEGVEQAVSRAPLTLSADKTTWTVTKSQLASWLDAEPQEEGPAKLGFNGVAISKYLESKAPEFAVAPTDAVFEMSEGKVKRIEAHRNGTKLDIDGAIAALRAAVFGPERPERVELPIIATEPEITTEKSNPYGIREIIGIGSSSAKGSPTNRRVNIAVGAATLDGLIIPADTEFSLIKALGPIDGEHGYRQELVIKDNKTTPEYGGGLCQIGTTTFRTALATGLPITQRQNHSYRVPYYERDGDGKYMGPGKDATIYDPWPDLRFQNDTGHPIAIMTDIQGDKITFTFWGVGDGRKAEQTDAKVWDITQPPEKKVVPTDTLAPGVEKCTELAHAGAKAAFDYTVTYADGTVKEKTFTSLYRPWGEVCLVGIDPNAPPAPVDGTVPNNAGATISADAAGVQGE